MKDRERKKLRMIFLSIEKYILKDKERSLEEGKKKVANKRMSKVKLVTVVESDLKAPFSVATTPRCRGGRDSFPGIAPLYP